MTASASVSNVEKNMVSTIDTVREGEDEKHLTVPIDKTQTRQSPSPSAKKQENLPVVEHLKVPHLRKRSTKDQEKNQSKTKKSIDL